MSLISGFDSPTETDIRKLWSEGTFVLDTSVLLNLHRYREKVRDDILDGLHSIKDRLWIPFHVALEYERNRLGVIAKQLHNIHKAREKVFSIPDLVRNSLQDTEVFRRHALINANEMLGELEKLRDKFCAEIDAIQSNVPEAHKHDKVRERIKELLADRIGPAPQSQKAISDINDAGNGRYARFQPPGYLDQEKANAKDSAIFSFGGINYERRFGDLYAWEQLKTHAKTLKGAPICFVTDDQKEDWWWMIESNGTKRLGPRPELKEELLRECGTGFFHMYSPDAFLENMNRYKDAGIDPDSVTEAREVSREVSTISLATQASLAVTKWIQNNHAEDATFATSRFPDLLQLDASGEKVETGYEVIYLPALAVPSIPTRLSKLAEAAERFCQKFPGATLRLMLVFGNRSSAEKALQLVKAIDLHFLPEQVFVCTGHVDRESGTYQHLGCFMRASVTSGLILSS